MNFSKTTMTKTSTFKTEPNAITSNDVCAGLVLHLLNVLKNAFDEESSLKRHFSDCLANLLKDLKIIQEEENRIGAIFDDCDDIKKILDKASELYSAHSNKTQSEHKTKFCFLLLTYEKIISKVIDEIFQQDNNPCELITKIIRNLKNNLIDILSDIQDAAKVLHNNNNEKSTKFDDDTLLQDFVDHFSKIFFIYEIAQIVLKKCEGILTQMDQCDEKRKLGISINEISRISGSLKDHFLDHSKICNDTYKVFEYLISNYSFIEKHLNQSDQQGLCINKFFSSLKKKVLPLFKDDVDFKEFIDQATHCKNVLNKNNKSSEICTYNDDQDQQPSTTLLSILCTNIASIKQIFCGCNHK